MSIPKKILVFCFFLFCLPLYASPLTYNVILTENNVAKKTEPQDFATIFYGIVLSNDEQVGLDNADQIAKFFFTKELFAQYKKVRAKDAHTSEVGRLNDFNNFTGAQEFISGFWIGKPQLNQDQALVPIYLNLTGNKFALNKPTIQLQLKRTSNGWKIDDISYVDLKTSLRKLMS